MGHRHGLLGVRRSNALAGYKSYETGYFLGRVQSLAGTVLCVAGVLFSLGVVVYTMV